MATAEIGKGEVTSVVNDVNNLTINIGVLGKDSFNGNWSHFSITFGPGSARNFADLILKRIEQLEQPGLPFD